MEITEFKGLHPHAAPAMQRCWHPDQPFCISGDRLICKSRTGKESFFKFPFLLYEDSVEYTILYYHARGMAFNHSDNLLPVFQKCGC